MPQNQNRLLSGWILLAQQQEVDAA